MKYLDANGELIETEVHLRTAYNYDTDAISRATGLECKDVSLAQQQFKKEADINEIVRRFGLTGQMPENFNMPSSGDFTESVTDFHTAMNLITKANEEFDSLPAQLRRRFNNNPQELLAFVEDDGNIEEANKLGLLKEKPAEVIKPADYTPPPAEPAA